jgi:hypothetical protein
MGDYITIKDEKLVEYIQKHNRMLHGKELSKQEVCDIIEGSNLLLLVSRGPYVCSKCGETEYAE